MIYDVEFTSSDKSVVEVRNGFLYAAGEGTATITAKPSHWMDDSNNFVFHVKVEGTAMPIFIEELTVGAYDNHTKEVSRDVTGGGISVDCGTELTLYPSFKPWYVTSVPDLTWEVSDSEVAEILKSDANSARVLCKKTGGVSILLSSPSNGLIGTFTIIIGEEFNLTSYYFREYKGIGYSETYTDEKGNERKMLVIPANLGIYVMGSYSSSVTYDGTFEDLQTLDTVVVPQGVNSIGAYCFRNTSLRRIYLPSSIEHISSAAFWMVAAVIVPGSELTLKNVGLNPTRDGIIKVCRAMGGDITVCDERVQGGEPVGDLLVRSSSLHGTTVSGDIIPTLIDELPIIAVLAAYAEGRTVIADAAELKVKECNRIDAMVTNLSKMGVDITGTDDGMIIEGGKALHGAELDTYMDHRIAMSFAIASLNAEGTTTIKDAEIVNVSYPGFFNDLKGLMNR